LYHHCITIVSPLKLIFHCGWPMSSLFS